MKNEVTMRRNKGAMIYQTKLRKIDCDDIKFAGWQGAPGISELTWRGAGANSKFKLRAQLADTARSMAANKAEGYGHFSPGKFIQCPGRHRVLADGHRQEQGGRFSIFRFIAPDPHYFPSRFHA